MSRSPRARRALVATLSLATALAALVAPATTPPALADDAATLTVVGTSDVFDSNLLQSVIKPGFEAAYPQYTLNYVSKGTGAAIAFAKAGTASAMIVHAAALENQFVAEGYSLEEYGRATFWGDYVLLGPASDPAGILVDGQPSHDIVGAFEKIAAAGAEGRADFVSRGGTPGTTVQEHAIWSYADPSAVTMCTVSAANGGGTSPSTETGNCSSPIKIPSWYHATGLTQAPNVLNGDACNGYPTTSCYVFTDRGTYQYLASTGAIANLRIVTRDNDVAGQLDLLVNSFHAYAIDPAKFAGNPDVSINTAAATAFLDWLTSPTGQSAVGAFLDDEGDPPFLPSAAPIITVDPAPSAVRAGRAVTISGRLDNAVPGTPELAGVAVDLLARPVDQPSAPLARVGGGVTDATGAFSISDVPDRALVYTVAVDGFSQVVVDTLDPVFGDLMTGTSKAAAVVQVQSEVLLSSAKVTKRRLAVTGVLRPVAPPQGRVTLQVARIGGEFRNLISGRATGSRYSLGARLAPGKWRVRTVYTANGQLLPDTSPIRKVTVR